MNDNLRFSTFYISQKARRSRDVLLKYMETWSPGAYCEDAYISEFLWRNYLFEKLRPLGRVNVSTEVELDWLVLVRRGEPWYCMIGVLVLVVGELSNIWDVAQRTHLTPSTMKTFCGVTANYKTLPNKYKASVYSPAKQPAPTKTKTKEVSSIFKNDINLHNQRKKRHRI